MALHRLDVRGKICPDPLTLAKKQMERLAAGDMLVVTLDYPLALETLTHWAERAGHRVIEVKEVGKTQWEMWIEKVR